jgi:acetylornithine deacetylase/succinyl-diaminopimelate desuccinylase-like protein
VADGTAVDAAVLAPIAGAREELAELTLRLSHLPDLSGFERPVAEAVAGWLTDAGMVVELDEITPTSANVRAMVSGPDGGGGEPALILSSHLDTEGALPAGDETERRHLRGAWREGDLLVGKGLVNDRTQLAAMMLAMRTVARSGLPLRGGLVFLGTAQECGAPVDPSAPRGRDDGPHMREGYGARWALERGFGGRAALIGEPTGFAISRAQAGYLRVRVSVPGYVPYTPFIERGPTPLDTPNSFERAGPVLVRLLEWSKAYERRERFPFPGGTVAPKAQVQEIRRTAPLFTQQDDPCDIYLDIRTAPGRDEDALVADLAGALDGLGFTCELTAYDRATGYVAAGAEPVAAAVERAHRRVFGEPPPTPRDPQVSMWHDSNAFNEHGIPAISYGIGPHPEPWTRERFRSARVDDLVRLAQVYALTALEICGDGDRPAESRDVD